MKHLEAVEPRVKAVAEQQHIDYHFARLDDDDDENISEIYDDHDGDEEEDDDDFSMDYDSDRQSGDGQLSSPYKSRELPTSRNLMEVLFLITHHLSLVSFHHLHVFVFLERMLIYVSFVVVTYQIDQVNRTRSPEPPKEPLKEHTNVSVFIYLYFL